MERIEYDFTTISYYPELEGYLKLKLSELGKVKLKKHPRLLYGNFVATITLPDFPKIWNWRTDEKRPSNILYINKDGGGCFIRGGIVTYTILPQKNSKEVGFHFSLRLDSRDIPVEEHKPELLMSYINEFVNQAKNGFCYWF